MTRYASPKKRRKRQKKAAKRAAEEAQRRADAAARATAEAAKRAEGQLTKFGLSKGTCREIFRAAKGAGKLSKPLEIAFKKVAQENKKKTGRFNSSKSDSKFFASLNGNAILFSQIKSAVDLIEKKGPQLRKLFSPKNMCGKNGAWFVQKLASLGIDPRRLITADISKPSPNSFALHDLIFTPAVAKSNKRSATFTGIYLAADLGFMAGYTVGFEVVINQRSGEARTYFTHGPTVGPAAGIDAAFGVMTYGGKGFAKARWSDFPGKGQTLEFGPEIPTSGPPGSPGPGVNMVLSSPYGRKGFMGIGGSAGGGYSAGVASWGPDYTSRLF